MNLIKIDVKGNDYYFNPEYIINIIKVDKKNYNIVLSDNAVIIVNEKELNNILDTDGISVEDISWR